MLFSVSMAGGRLAGTAVIERLGRVLALRLAGLVGGPEVLVTIRLLGIGGSLVGSIGWGLRVALMFASAMCAAAMAQPPTGRASRTG